MPDIGAIVDKLRPVINTKSKTLGYLHRNFIFVEKSH